MLPGDPALNTSSLSSNVTGEKKLFLDDLGLALQDCMGTIILKPLVFELFRTLDRYRNKRSPPRIQTPTIDTTVAITVVVVAAFDAALLLSLKTRIVGVFVGLADVGEVVGLAEGSVDGVEDGLIVGVVVGLVGCDVGLTVGPDGWPVG